VMVERTGVSKECVHMFQFWAKNPVFTYGLNLKLYLNTATELIFVKVCKVHASRLVRGERRVGYIATPHVYTCKLYHKWP
jgi:hypothetical protein